jgi:PAS domain S-box-containing protein
LETESHNQTKKVDKALSALDETVIVFDRSGKILYVNQYYAGSLGMKQSDLIGRTLKEISEPAEVYDAIGTAIKEAIKTGKPFSVEQDRPKANGMRRFLFTVSPLSVDDAHDVVFVVTSRDIIERKRAEDVLCESEGHNRLLFETMLQGVVFQDADGTIISMNGAAERILGKGPAEFLGETSEGVEHHTVREDGTPFPGIEHPAMVALATGQKIQGVIMGVLNPREKKYHWISVDAVPLFKSGEGKPCQVYTIFSDITERKRLEAESNRVTRQLEIIHETTNIATSSLNIMDVSQRVLDKIGERFDLVTATLFLINAEQTELKPTALYGIKPKDYKSIAPFKVDSNYETARAFKTGVPLVIEDVSAPEVPQIAKEAVKELTPLIGKEIRSYIVLPLIAYQKNIGVLTPTWSMPRAFTQEDVDFFMSIAHEIAVGLENARLFEEQKEAARLSESLAKIDTIIFSSLDIEQRLKDVLCEAAKTIGTDMGGVNLREGGYWKRVALYGLPEKYLGERLTDEQNKIAALVARTKEPAIVNNAENDPRIDREFVRKYGIGSSVVFPLLAQDETVGVIFLNYHSIPTAFTRVQLDFISKLATSLSLAIENSRLYEAEVAAQDKAKSELEISNLLLKVADSLAATFDLDETLRQLAQLLMEATGRSRVFINLIDMSKRELILKVASGGIKVPFGQVVSFDHLSQTALKAIYAKRTTVSDYELPETPEYDKKIARKNNSRLVLFVPLLLKGEIIAHISLDEPGKRHLFSKREIEIVEGVASQAAVTIENVRLYKQTEDELSRTKLLQEVAVAVTSSASLKGIAKKVLETISEHMDLESGVVHILDKADLVLKYIAYLNYTDEAVSYIKELPVDSESTLASKALRENRVITQSEDNITPEREQLLRNVGAWDNRYVAIPFEYRGVVLGTTSLVFKGRRDFSREEISIFHSIGHIMGQAVENARLYEEERNVANTLQKAILATPEKIDGVRFGHLYRSAAEEALVGGDFYDLFELGNDKVAIALGDVSGKGLEAASITSMVKNAIKAFSYEYGTPAAIITRVNNLIVKNTSANIFVTVFLGILNTKTGEFQYCSAGHPPAIIKQGSTVELLNEHSPIIGAFSDVSYRNVKANLRKNGVLIIYTDGIIEARSASGFYGEDRLLEFIASLEDMQVERMPQAILDDVKKYSNGLLFDDVALLAVSLD